MSKYKGDILCSYGCGHKAKYFFTSTKKYCCSSHFSQCPIRRKQSKNYMTGLRVGNKNPRYGVKMSNELKEKIRKGNKENNYNPSIKTREKMAISSKLSIKNINIKYKLFSKIENLRYKPAHKKEKIIQVRCKSNNCNKWFTPSYIQLYERIRNIEINELDNSYFYCSEKCKEECPLYGKRVETLIKEDKINVGHIEESWYTSQEYQTWRDQVFKLDNSKCVWCNKEATIAHHILPQKIYPNLSLDPENGLSCCQKCHYKYGHRDSLCNTNHLSKLICDRTYRIKNR